MKFDLHYRGSFKNQHNSENNLVEIGTLPKLLPKKWSGSHHLQSKLNRGVRVYQIKLFFVHFTLIAICWSSDDWLWWGTLQIDQGEAISTYFCWWWHNCCSALLRNRCTVLCWSAQQPIADGIVRFWKLVMNGLHWHYHRRRRTERVIHQRGVTRLRGVCTYLPTISRWWWWWRRYL